MRSSHLQRPQARFNKNKSKSKQMSVGELRTAKQNSNEQISAEDRVNAFLSQLNTTPIHTKPTKKIHYATKTNGNNNNRRNNNNNKNKNNNNNNNNKDKAIVISKQRNRNNRRNNSIQQRKTSLSRPMCNNNMEYQATKTRKKSLSVSNCKSPPIPNENKIDQYSLSLQIKNSECEVLKSENKELKNRNQHLLDIQNEHQFCKEKILNLHNELSDKTDRIFKLEHKLESVGIDPIALKSPQFMNQDIQKNIIFWRERLYKASQRLNQKKIKQGEIMQTAQYYIQQLQNT